MSSEINQTPKYIIDNPYIFSTSEVLIPLNEGARRSIVAQAISAVHNHLKNEEVPPFLNSDILLTEPNGDRFFVGELSAKLEPESNSFKIQSVKIKAIIKSKTEMRTLMTWLETHRPGTTEISSDSFRSAFSTSHQTSEI